MRKKGARTVIQGYIPYELLLKVDKVAEKLGMSRSELVRRALEYYLEVLEGSILPEF